MRFTYLIFLLSLGNLLYAQITVFGQIRDSKFHEVLPYVNIGIPSEGIGTVTDKEGYYFIEFSDELLNKEILFSMVGFKSQSISINNLEKIEGEILLNLTLDTQVYDLNEVVVSNGIWEQKAIGNDTDSKLITGGFTSNQLGNEIAQYVRVKKQRPTYIESFWLSVVENAFDSVLLRLNIYSEDEGFPDENILKEPIYIELPNTPQVIEIDLKEYDIFVEDNFFISLEWIEDLGVDQLLFSAGVLGKPLYARNASQGKWVKQNFNIGMGVNISQRKN